MRLAQMEIRATVSVNMFELSCRKRDDDGDVGAIRFKKGKRAARALLRLQDTLRVSERGSLPLCQNKDPK